jgi:hypothetical protein
MQGCAAFTGHLRPLQELNDQHPQSPAHCSQGQPQGCGRLAFAVSGVDVCVTCAELAQGMILGALEKGKRGQEEKEINPLFSSSPLLLFMSRFVLI